MTSDCKSMETSLASTTSAWSDSSWVDYPDEMHGDYCEQYDEERDDWDYYEDTIAKAKVSSAADIMCAAVNGTWPRIAQYPNKASSEIGRRARAKVLENGDLLSKEDMENALANKQRYFSGHARERKENQMRRAKEGLAAASGNFLQH